MKKTNNQLYLTLVLKKKSLLEAVRTTIFLFDYAIVPTSSEAVFNGRIYSKTEIGDLIKDYIKDKPIRN